MQTTASEMRTSAPELLDLGGTQMGSKALYPYLIKVPIIGTVVVTVDMTGRACEETGSASEVRGRTRKHTVRMQATTKVS